MVRLSVYLTLSLGLISCITEPGTVQSSPLDPIWSKWEQEGWHCVTDWGGDIVSFSYVGASNRSREQVEFNGGTGRLEWNGTPFNLIDDWGDITREQRMRSFHLPPGPAPPDPCSAYREWDEWCYVNHGERTWCGTGNPIGGQIIDVRGWRRFDYLGYMLSDSFYPGPGWWYADFGGPIQNREYIFYIPPTPDRIAKVVVQVEPNLEWWNRYKPSSRDYKINDTVAKEGTRLRFELGDMGTGKIHAALGFTPSAERFATEDIRWGEGKWRWRSEYTYKHLLHYGAYLVNRVAGIHSSKIPIYPSLSPLGEEDSKTEILYPDIWIRPNKVDIEIREAVTWNHIRHLKGVDPYKVQWDGKDDNGNIVPKGLYSIRVIIPPDSTHEYYDSLDGGVSRPIESSNKFWIDGWVSATQPDKIIFGYAGTSTDILNQPKDCYVYMNLYDDEFRLVKRLLERKWVPMGEAGEISWDYRPYSPGTYYWTVWGKDSLGNQAHVRAGRFTVPIHLIQGTREPYPEDIPGWDKEGPIVRVRQPALVVGKDREEREDKTEWATKVMAEAVAKVLKNKDNMNYKLVGNKYHIVNGTTNDATSTVHIGLEASDIFYFAGHGNPYAIAAKNDGSTWLLKSGDIVHDKKLHTGNKVLMLWGYHFVQLDGCKTGADYSRGLPSRFIPESFLGWKHEIKLPYPETESWHNKHGRNIKNWTIKFWSALEKGKSVKEATEEASAHATTKNVPIQYGLEIHNGLLYLK